MMTKIQKKSDVIITLSHISHIFTLMDNRSFVIAAISDPSSRGRASGSL